MWLALRMLVWVTRGGALFSAFTVVLLATYCAAGFAALEPRHTMPGHLVQWLCTSWGSREALLQGPLKLLGALFLIPFVASVIAAHIWLRTVSFLVWLTVAYPCCRLQRADNVYDAFEREVAVPLLQCSFQAFACTFAAIVLGIGSLSSMQRLFVGMTTLYYTGMLMMWTSPTVLQAKITAEESFDATFS